jgi:hypothetical protein
MIIDFGKYKGKNVGEVSTQYLAWGAVYLSNRWRDVFEQEYDSRLHRELYKFQVFLNTTEPEECLSLPQDLLRSLRLYKRFWGNKKIAYIENDEITIILPQELDERQKDTLDFYLKSTSTMMEYCCELNHNNYRQF